jgi:carboxypeptidase family protein/outer membrane beta-barrel protein/TonB-dependent receptor-like protein
MKTLTRVHFVILSLLLLAVALPALAEDKGTITGKVTDKRTGHALPFANVALVGVPKGGLTDSEGRFSIPGVPFGTYDVKVQFLGYKAETQPGVVVAAGKAAVLDIKLEEVIVHEEKAVEVTAERRLVEAKQGATVRSVSANEIRNLPVATVADVLQQQAGISTDADQIHVRGGRADETMFVVNGVANRDLVTGQSTAGQLNARSVAEVNVSTGAFDVRYGNALSGIVEIRLKEGSDKAQFGLTTSAGSYGGRAWQTLVSGPDPVIAPGLALVGVHLPGTATSVLDLSGSLFETRFSYLGQTGLSLLDRTVLPPFLHPRLLSSYEDRFLGYRFHYGDMWGPSQDNRWAGRYGWFWKPDNKNKLSFNFSKRIAIDQGFSRTFLTAQGDLGDPAYPWQWDHRIGNAPTIFEDNVQNSLEWRRTLSLNGFSTLQLSRYFYAQRQDVQGKNWTQFVEPDDRSSFPLGDPRRDDYFFDTGDDNQWADRRTDSWGLQGSVTQRIRHNEVEFGFDHQWQSVQYLTIENPWVFDKDGLGQSHDLWSVHPMVGAAYGRDRLEFEGFVANVGLRADYWFQGREAEQAMDDTTRHNIAPTTRTAFFNDTRSFFGRRVKVHFSPRVIVAHPITENSSFFFNYGEFTQNPSYRYVYSKLNSISSESFPLQGNPDLNPQVSVNYEVGGKHQFLPTAAANVTFFVRDVYDYPNATRVDPLSGTNLQSYFIYLNGHYARSKGFEVELEKRRSNHWSGKLSYSYQQTRGKSSDPNEERALQEIGGSNESRLSEEFVRWNRPSKLTASFDVRFDDKAPSGLGWARRMGLNVYMQGQSGRAYTPLDINAIGPTGLPNSKNAPVQYTTDLKLNRWFKLGDRRFDLSIAGTNVFNNYLYNRVDAITGLGRVWGQGEFDPNHVSGINDYTHVSQVDDPSNYGPGAQWRLQLDADL